MTAVLIIVAVLVVYIACGFGVSYILVRYGDTPLVTYRGEVDPFVLFCGIVVWPVMVVMFIIMAASQVLARFLQRYVPKDDK